MRAQKFSNLGNKISCIILKLQFFLKKVVYIIKYYMGKMCLYNTSVLLLDHSLKAYVPLQLNSKYTLVIDWWVMVVVVWFCFFPLSFFMLRTMGEVIT